MEPYRRYVQRRHTGRFCQTHQSARARSSSGWKPGLSRIGEAVAEMAYAGSASWGEPVHVGGNRKDRRDLVRREPLPFLRSTIGGILPGSASGSEAESGLDTNRLAPGAGQRNAPGDPVAQEQGEPY